MALSIVLVVNVMLDSNLCESPKIDPNSVKHTNHRKSRLFLPIAVRNNKVKKSRINYVQTLTLHVRHKEYAALQQIPRVKLSAVCCKIHLSTYTYSVACLL